MLRTKRKAELNEDNEGLRLQNLNENNEMKRLTDILKRNSTELNKCVETGSAPFFGYPPVLYSPYENL